MMMLSADHHAARYRRRVCQLLSGTDNVVLKELETHLGQKALRQHDYIESSDPPPSNNADNLDMRVPPSLLHCHVCGAYQSGRFRVRKLHRGRTRRRRASRDKSRPSKKQEGGSVEEELQKHLYRVTQGDCKNAVVKTCKDCGHAVKLKGLPVQNNRSQQNLKQSSTSSTVLPSTDSNLLEGDFVPLAREQPGAEKKEGRKREKPETSNLLLQPNKKKRKPKQKENKSGLMDFLSSLNN